MELLATTLFLALLILGQLLTHSTVALVQICASKDLLDQPMIRSALVNVIQINPNELMSMLGIKLTFDRPSITKP